MYEKKMMIKRADTSFEGGREEQEDALLMKLI